MQLWLYCQYKTDSVCKEPVEIFGAVSVWLFERLRVLYNLYERQTGLESMCLDGTNHQQLCPSHRWKHP
jgi:hypothetical protein